jgi:hypothetical protein
MFMRAETSGVGRRLHLSRCSSTKSSRENPGCVGCRHGSIDPRDGSIFGGKDDEYDPPTGAYYVSTIAVPEILDKPSKEEPYALLKRR